MISIIIVTYNAAITLQSCLNSIFSQNKRDQIKIIIIDGNSTDNTILILKNNNNSIDYWFSEKDDGIYDAMNKALEKVNTPWVYFLGADDELLPDFSNILKELNNPKNIYYSNVIYKDAKHSGKVNPYHQAKHGIFHQSIIYPLIVFKNYKYNVKYKIAADYALNMQLYKDPTFKLKYLNYTIAKYSHNGISAKVVDKAFENDKLKLIYTNFGAKIWLRFLFRKLKAMA